MGTVVLYENPADHLFVDQKLRQLKEDGLLEFELLKTQEELYGRLGRGDVSWTVYHGLKSCASEIRERFPLVKMACVSALFGYASYVNETAQAEVKRQYEEVFHRVIPFLMLN